MMMSRRPRTGVRVRGSHRRISLAVVFGVWVSSAAWTSQAEQPPSPQQAPTTTAPAKEPPENFRRVCIRCHTSDRVVQGRRFRSQFEELIEQMIARGAVVNDEDYEVIIKYLVAEFGRVDVNKATAPELAEVLQLEPAEADAIVAARKTAGRFADFDALVAAPGVPVDALTMRRDALFF